MKRGKFNNTITFVTGRKFHSAAEADRYEELCKLQEAGAISDLQCQVKFELQEGFETTINSRPETVEAIYYIADFTYREAGETWLVVEDLKGRKPSRKKAKGTITQEFELKVKLFRKRYPFPEYDFRIVAR